MAGKAGGVAVAPKKLQWGYSEQSNQEYHQTMKNWVRLLITSLLLTVMVMAFSPAAIANRFAVLSRQAVYDNPCKAPTACNNQYTTDEEARIASQRQGTPVDGSPLMTCDAGITLSIDYGRPSFALCVDFRTDLDAPTAATALPTVNAATAAAEAAAAEAAATAARTAAQAAQAAAAAAATASANAQKSYDENAVKAAIAAAEANAAAAKAEAEAARQATRAAGTSTSSTIKPIQFAAPKDLNGSQLLSELAAAGVNVTGNLSMNGGWLTISLPENQSATAGSVIAAHIGLQPAPVVATPVPKVSSTQNTSIVSEKLEDQLETNTQTSKIDGKEVTTKVTTKVTFVGDGPKESDPLPNFKTGDLLSLVWTIINSEVNSPPISYFADKFSCPLGSSLTIDFGYNGNRFANALNCIKTWSVYTKIETITTTTTEAVATTPTETPVATTPTETPVATTPTETPVATTPTETPVATTPTETPVATAQLTALSSSEKENLLKAVYKSSKASTLSVITDVANSVLVITATKKGSPTLTFKVTTNDAGDAKVKTTKNLAGYTVTLSSDGIKLDSDKVTK